MLGGVDSTGPHLYCIYPHGSTDALPYVTMGSGSLAAMSVFEDRYKPNMDVSNFDGLVQDCSVSSVLAMGKLDYSDITWVWWCHQSLATWLFIQQLVQADSKEILKLYITGPLWEEFTGDQWSLIMSQ